MYSPLRKLMRSLGQKSLAASYSTQKPPSSPMPPESTHTQITLQEWSSTSNSWKSYQSKNASRLQTNVPGERTLNVATWNVWFDTKTSSKERWAALYALLFRSSEQQPLQLDVVALQEMTKVSWSQLLTLPEVQEEWAVTEFTGVLKATGSWYGTVILIRKDWLRENGLECKDPVLVKFPTFMGRALLAIELYDEAGVALRIGTSHFESGYNDEGLRSEQFCIAAKLLSRPRSQPITDAGVSTSDERTPHAIVCGDTNIFKPSELDPLINPPHSYIDTYAAIHPSASGDAHFTFGTTYPSPFLQTKRIDYLLYRPDSDSKRNPKVLEARLIGDEPIEGQSCTNGRNGKLYPSDHLGVVVRLVGL